MSQMNSELVPQDQIGLKTSTVFEKKIEPFFTTPSNLV